MPTSNLATLTAELRARLFAYIHTRVHLREVAEDLLQDTLLRASRTLAAHDIANIEGWLFRVARNGIADYFRGSKDRVEWRDGEHSEAARDDVMLKEDRELHEVLTAYVRGVVESLAEPYRSALLLTEYEGLTQKEVAERVGITLSAAKSRVQRGRAELKQLIEQCCRIATDRYGHVTECKPHHRDQCAC